MINLPVDEAAAFDAMAILMVKQQRRLSVIHEMVALEKSIRAQIGPKFTDEVILSCEFADLVKANRKTFDMVAMASKDECRASEVDAANQSRYAAKRALQERFWPSNPLTEVKAQRPASLPTEPITPTVPLNGGA